MSLTDILLALSEHETRPLDADDQILAAHSAELDNITAGSVATVEALELKIAEQTAKIVALQAHNYELLVGNSNEPEPEPEPEPESESDDVDVDDFFEEVK